MVKAVIFDIDGTLLDSVDLHAEAWQKAFQKFGYHFPLDQIRSQIGKGGDQLLPVFLSEKDQKEKGKEISEYRSQLFKGEYLQKVEPFPYVRELFEKVKAHGQRPALASSAQGDELKIFERIAHVEDLVDVETSSADAKKSKPHPDIFEAALNRLGSDVRPEEVVVVGDSPHDAEAAGKAGIQTVGVLCGGFAENDLRKSGCIAIFRDPEDLWRRYEDSPLAPNR